MTRAHPPLLQFLVDFSQAAQGQGEELAQITMKEAEMTTDVLFLPDPSSMVVLFGSILVGSFTLLNFTHHRTDHLSLRARGCHSAKINHERVPMGKMQFYQKNLDEQSDLFIDRYQWMVWAFTMLYVSIFLSMLSCVIFAFRFTQFAFGFAIVDLCTIMVGLTICLFEFHKGKKTLELDQKLAAHLASEAP